MKKKKIFKKILTEIIIINDGYVRRSEQQPWKYYGIEHETLTKEEISHRRCGAMTALCDINDYVTELMRKNYE